MRNKFVSTAKKYLGCKESDGSHRKIIDRYNKIKPLPQGYKVKYTDSWCATFVSAMADIAGLAHKVPIECSCPRMVAKAIKMGIWQEKDSYVPKKGDIVMYDWQDSGKGDNKGTPDHVGIVAYISGNSMKIIEGNYNDKVAYRTLKVNGKYIRGYITPKFTTLAKKTSKKTHVVRPTDTLSGIAKKYGTTVEAIAKKNNIKNVDLIIDGQVLKI